MIYRRVRICVPDNIIAPSDLAKVWGKLPSFFTFSVIYQIQSKHIYIVAIMHNSKRPGYWLKRT
jgi:hypothetical protein